MTKEVCVIGAGLSGLVAVKQCLEEELQPTCYEKESELGGLWQYKETVEDGRPSLYASCVMNYSKEFETYSDFPMPKEFPNFMHYSKFKIYIDMYASRFNVKQYIKFKHIITKIDKADDFQDSGKWKITSQDLKTGEIEQKVFDFVMVCNGHLFKPVIPTFAGLDTFKGHVLHTHDYKDFRKFENKKVVIIGMGNSSADISSELSRHAKQVIVSTRRGAYLTQKSDIDGTPHDHLSLTRFMQLPFHFLKDNSNQKASKYGLAPTFSFTAGCATISDDLANRILVGSIVIRANVDHFTEHGVVFEDKSREDDVDYVIFATGYSVSFPFLDRSVLEVRNGFAPLYMMIFPPHLPRGTLGIVGLVQPAGPLPPVLEMQARYLCRVFAGHCKLPSCQIMQTAIEERDKIMKPIVAESPRFYININYIQYIDSIATIIGCKPKLLKYCFTNPRFWYKLYFGPTLPAQWRIDGPGKWKDARKSIEISEYKTWYPFATRTTDTGKQTTLVESPISLVTKVMLFTAIVSFTLMFYK